MHFVRSHYFRGIYGEIAQLLDTLGERVTNTQTWQAQKIEGRQDMVPVELQNVVFELPMPLTMDHAQKAIKPNLPWAEDHFQERVGGLPLNPPPSAKTWPFAQAGHAEHTNGRGEFSHTYPERFWPKHAGHEVAGMCNGTSVECGWDNNRGVRFAYGDLNDVARLLHDDPATRQAYLPIWFPEDTGANEGQRVPCSLGYHFMIRGGLLHVTYMIRAVDFMRHFQDDVYMAIRLGQLMVKWANVPGLSIGNLTMHTMSMHCFVGDVHRLDSIAHQVSLENSRRLLGALG